MTTTQEGKKTVRVIVIHASYGCESGCCGHAVLIERDGSRESRFEFTHPYGKDHLRFAKDLVRSTYGAEHVADLDWDNCIIEED